MKKDSGFIIASTIFLPLLGILFLVLVPWGFAIIGTDGPAFAFVAFAFVFASIANWPKITLGVLGLAAITLVQAFSVKERRKYQSVLLVVYCVTLAVYGVCAIWAAIAKPVIEF